MRRFSPKELHFVHIFKLKAPHMARELKLSAIAFYLSILRPSFANDGMGSRLISRIQSWISFDESRVNEQESTRIVSQAEQAAPSLSNERAGSSQELTRIVSQAKQAAPSLSNQRPGSSRPEESTMIVSQAERAAPSLSNQRPDSSQSRCVY